MENLCTVLVVDDDPIARSTAGRLLRQKGFEVIECRDGRGAIASLEAVNRQNRYGLLLLDFEMPGENGASVCKEIRTHRDPDIAEVPIIFITGHPELENEVACLEAGGDDFISKPFNLPSLLARIKTLQRVEMLRRELREKNRLLEAAQAEIECDLAGAEQIQRAVIRERLEAPEGWEVAARYLPLIQVGGDAFDSLLLPSEERLFWIADATGHGVSAALSTTLIKLLFRYGANGRPGAVLERVDRDFRGVFRGRSFFTAACIKLSSNDGRVVAAGAGHPPLYWIKQDGSLERIVSMAPPIGLNSGQIREETFVLASGEGLFAYTDGLFEQEHRNRFFTEDFFARWRAGVPLEEILSSGVRSAQAGHPGGVFKDDVAAILLRRR